MTVLLDTHAFIWFYNSPERLTGLAYRILDANGTKIFVSIATPWEMSVKKSIGKLQTSHSIPYIMEIHRDIVFFLSIEAHHLAIVENLPLHHRDPFDRLIIAQALAEKIPVISSDTAFDAYGVERIWD